MLQGRRDYSGMQAPDVPDNTTAIHCQRGDVSVVIVFNSKPSTLLAS
jgi:hypothetical protein